MALAVSSAEREQLLQQLHQQLDQLIDERQDDLKAAFKQLGLSEVDFSLDGGDDGSSGSGSSRRKQLTGR